MTEYQNSSLTQNHLYILIKRVTNTKTTPIDKNSWNDAFYGNYIIPFSKFQIKESDMRVKTASFTSNTYLDLTTGLYAIYIVSLYHENFAGVILSVDDNDDGTYTYQCQDWSRLYQGNFSHCFSNTRVYDIIRYMLLRGYAGDYPFDKTKYQKYKYMLSGLRPLAYYNNDWWGNSKKFNPMETKRNVIIEDKSYIQAIRDLVYGGGGYIDVFFANNGALQIKPYSYNEWITNGIYITTEELASRKWKFDTTNMITSVVVKNSDSSKTGKTYSSSNLTGLDLAVFFGDLGTTISNPNQTTTTKTTSSSKSKNVPVHMNMDIIGTKSQDNQLMSDLASLLKKKGYTVTKGARNPNAHYSEINKVKKNGIYFTIVGGLCAGTIKSLCNDAHFKNALKKKNAKMVIGHKEPNKTTKWRLINSLTWLPRAHDDNFSPKSFKGISNPRKMILNAGIGIAQGTTAKEIASTFPGFKTASSKNNNTAIVNTQTTDAINKEKESALKELSKPLRNLMKMTITLPLGNLSFKNLHTNMFCYTELPNTVENMGTISTALKGYYTRYIGYKLNRWYIEGITINYDNGKYTMDLELNPFPSNFVEYVDNKNKYSKAYNEAQKKSASSTSTTKKESDNYTNVGKRSDGKTCCIDTYYLTTKKGQNNIKKLTNSSENKLSRQWIGKTGTNYHKFVKGCKTAKEVYKKLCTIIPVKVASYANTKYKCPENAFNHPENLNCAERSRLFKSCCDSLQIPCVIYHVEHHYMNGVLINGKWKTADLCYRSGIRHKDYNTAGFNK